MRGIVIVLLSLLGAVSPAPPASSDCQGVMAVLGAAQGDAQDQLDVVNTLEAAMNAPGWDPVADGWMIDAYGGAVDDLIGYLNAAAIAEDQAHAAHCYLNFAQEHTP